MEPMSPDKEAAIFARYPEIFRDRTKPMTESCMHWGLETGDGWENIIVGLCEAIDHPWEGGANTKEDGSDAGLSYKFPQVVATQVKSKYGTLRFYYDLEYSPEFEEQAKLFPKTAAALRHHFLSYIDGAIGMAEAMSAITCEETGRPGELCVRGGWYKTLCPEEAKKQGFQTLAERQKQEAAQ